MFKAVFTEDTEKDKVYLSIEPYHELCQRTVRNRIPSCRWDPAKKIWTLPANYIDELLDILEAFSLETEELTCEDWNSRNRVHSKEPRNVDKKHVPPPSAW